jgi:hypothetical protein
MILRLLGFDVSEGATATLRRIASGPSSASLEEVKLSASLIEQLYYAYLKTSSLDRREAREVAHDAGIRLCNVAIAACRISPRLSLLVLIKALRLNGSLVVVLPLQIARRAITTLGGKA